MGDSGVEVVIPQFLLMILGFESQSRGVDRLNYPVLDRFHSSTKSNAFIGLHIFSRSIQNKWGMIYGETIGSALPVQFAGWSLPILFPSYQFSAA